MDIFGMRKYILAIIESFIMIYLGTESSYRNIFRTKVVELLKTQLLYVTKFFVSFKMADNGLKKSLLRTHIQVFELSLMVTTRRYDQGLVEYVFDFVENPELSVELILCINRFWLMLLLSTLLWSPGFTFNLANY